MKEFPKEWFNDNDKDSINNFFEYEVNMDEKQVIFDILKMGTESLSPDRFSELENIISILKNTRKGLKNEKNHA